MPLALAQEAQDELLKHLEVGSWQRNRNSPWASVGPTNQHCQVALSIISSGILLLRNLSYEEIRGTRADAFALALEGYPDGPARSISPKYSDSSLKFSRLDVSLFVMHKLPYL